MSDLDAARINQVLYIIENNLSQRVQAVQDLSNQELQQTILLHSAITNLTIVVEDLKLLTEELIRQTAKLNGTSL